MYAYIFFLLNNMPQELLFWEAAFVCIFHVDTMKRLYAVWVLLLKAPKVLGLSVPGIVPSQLQSFNLRIKYSIS